MKVSIIKYNGGNVQSVIFALNRIGIEPILSNDKNELQNSDKIIFPGVGEASSCMKSLRESGLDTLIPHLQQPVLGICVGLQLMCNFSEEGNTKGLGIFEINVRKFSNQQLDNHNTIKIPQMGWNTIFDLKTSLFDGISDQSYMYYVHSFAAELGKNTIAKTNYGINYSAALHKKNFYAIQFHAEKSSLAGSKIIENFISKTN